LEALKPGKIEGKAKFGDTKVTLWIDDDGLIRKIYHETVVDSTKIPARAKKRVPAMPALLTFTSYSTITSGIVQSWSLLSPNPQRNLRFNRCHKIQRDPIR